MCVRQSAAELGFGGGSTVIARSKDSELSVSQRHHLTELIQSAGPHHSAALIRVTQSSL